MRLPNGFGSVVKLSGKRRKPFLAKITAGWDDNGKQIRKCIGYAKTKKEAIELLVKYNANPYDIDLSNITFEELYNKWLPTRKDKLSKKGLLRYTNAYKYYEPLKKEKFVDIKYQHIQKIVDDCQYSYYIKSDIKSLYNQLYDHAIFLEVPVNKNYAENVDIGEKEVSDLHSDFTEQEIEKLWNNTHIDFVGAILIMIYTGLRPTELLLMKDVNLEEGYMRGGIKTKNGINRIIPINKKIYNFVVEYIVSGKLKISYSSFKRKFDKVMK